MGETHCNNMEVAICAAASKESQQCANESSGQAYLPDEIIIQIFEYVSTSKDKKTVQAILCSCCLVSHQWYSVAVPLLYRHPRLYGANFTLFERTICPSKNIHVRESRLAELVRVLDMSSAIHQLSKSDTARLLGRTKSNLEEFVAPQYGFGSNCFPALGKCQRLQRLNLSLICESPALPTLSKAITHLQGLQSLHLPRSSGFGIHHKPASFFSWPESLRELSLSGGIDAHFLYNVVSFPATLQSLSIEHCPNAKGFAITHLLRTTVRGLANLKSLTLAFLPRLGAHDLDDVLFLIPQITRLSISVDYITPAVFDQGNFKFRAIRHPLPVPAGVEDYAGLTHEEIRAINLSQHPLRHLELTNSGTMSGIEDKISPIDIIIALDDGSLPNLRQVRAATSLRWPLADAEALSDHLMDLCRKDHEAAQTGSDTPLSRHDGQALRDWTKWAGVWQFEG